VLCGAAIGITERASGGAKARGAAASLSGPVGVISRGLRYRRNSLGGSEIQHDQLVRGLGKSSRDAGGRPIPS
jgi:hypothetical protein